MNITTSITLNMQTPGYVVAYEPQGNKLSRFITATLKNGSASWSVPSGATAMIRVAKPDGTFAVYDKNENGQTAYTISGSTVTIELVGAALAAAGDALVTVMFLDSTGSNLSPFSFRLIIMPSAVSDDDIVSSDYFNIFQETIDSIQQMLTETQAMYGSPLTAATASAMTNTSKIYVYVGAESGYSYGHWYYYNGSAWVDGGVYNSEGINSNWIYESFFTGTFENTSLAHFTDGADNVPVKALTVAIDPVQSGTGDPSPTNVRPITGWTGANVNVAGKNLLPMTLVNLKAINTGGTWAGNTYTSNGVDFELIIDSAGNVTGIHVSGTAGATVIFWLGRVDAIAGTYYFNSGTDFASTNTYVRMTGPGKNNYTIQYIIRGAGTLEVPISTDVELWGNIRIGNGDTVDTIFKPYFGFTNTSVFEPYKCATYSISFGSAGTVYGGTLDVVSGELIVDKAIIDIGLQNWSSTSGFFYLPFATAQPSATDNITGDIICECYKNVARNSLLNYDHAITINSRSIVSIRDVRYTDVVSFKSALAGKHFVYKLANPITYQLTSTEVFTLLGANNFWADTGDIEELVYRADSSLYLDSKINATKSIIAGIETSMVATKSYSVGDLLIVGDVLYKAASPIASGAAFTPGTNVNATTVAEQLILLANS